MEVYLISYDLRQPDRDYNNLYDKIKCVALDWQHPMESLWIITTSDKNANSIYCDLKPAIDSNDFLLVIQLKNNPDRQGWLSSEFWKWLKTKL